MRHRIFIAINLPKDIKEGLSRCQKKIEKLFTPHRNRISGAGPCRWVKKENLHLTLAFLGYLNDEQLEQVYEIVKETTAKNKPFLIFLNKVGYGPRKKLPPRLIWIQGEKSEELLKLKKDLEELLTQKINFSPEERNFLPHITLARIKKWNWRQIEPEERPVVDLEVSFQLPVNSIEVMESHLKKTGAEYEILKSYKLKHSL